MTSERIGAESGDKVADPFGAFIEFIGERQPASDGPLAGTSFAVKDLLDVAGVPTMAGNPEFGLWRGVPDADARAVTILEEAGAMLVGKTHLHELAYGLTGINAHYGTPVNPAAPERIPGGSSSGSASAVAGGLVDFALGTDTGGSVRLPASFCGIYGYRPTYGAIPAEGVVALAPSFDTVGVFARSAELLERVSRFLLRQRSLRTANSFKGIFLAGDSSQVVSESAEQASRNIAKSLGEVLELTIQQIEVGALAEARDAQRVLQGAEAWAVHQQWLLEDKPALGSDVQRLLDAASRLTVAEIGRASSARSRITLRMEQLLGEDGLLIMPAAFGPAPTYASLEDSAAALEFRTGTLAVTNLASLVGLPVVSVPAAPEGELPLGVQLIGPRNSDSRLLELAVRLERYRERRRGT